MNKVNEHHILGDRNFHALANPTKNQPRLHHLSNQSIDVHRCSPRSQSHLWIFGEYSIAPEIPARRHPFSAVVRWLRFEEAVTELYDVQVIPEVESRLLEIFILNKLLN